MHGKAKCSDQFLWAVIKVCKILLRFFLAGFEYWLFKLELGCYSSCLLILPKLVVPPHKSPGAVAFIQHSLATAPSVASLMWLSSKMTESTFFLPFLLSSPLTSKVHVCTHTRTHTDTQTHRHWALTLNRNEKGKLCRTVCPRKYSSSEVGASDPGIIKETWDFFPSADLADDLNLLTTSLTTPQLCPPTSFWPYWICSVYSNTACIFLLWLCSDGNTLPPSSSDELYFPSSSQLRCHFYDPPGWWFRCPYYVLPWGASRHNLDYNFPLWCTCKLRDTEQGLSRSQTSMNVG